MRLTSIWRGEREKEMSQNFNLGVTFSHRRVRVADVLIAYLLSILLVSHSPTYYKNLARLGRRHDALDYSFWLFSNWDILNSNVHLTYIVRRKLEGEGNVNNFMMLHYSLLSSSNYPFLYSFPLISFPPNVLCFFFFFPAFLSSIEMALYNDNDYMI